MEPQIEFALFRLRTIRSDILDWTLEDVGNRMGVSRKFLGNLERLWREPKLSTIIKYCDALEIGIDVLLRGCPTSQGQCRVPHKRYLLPEHDALGLTRESAKALLDLHPLIEEYYWLAICLIEGHPAYTDACCEFMGSLQVLTKSGVKTTMTVSLPEYQEWDLHRRAT